MLRIGEASRSVVPFQLYYQGITKSVPETQKPLTAYAGKLGGRAHLVGGAGGVRVAVRSTAAATTNNAIIRVTTSNKELWY